MAFDWLIFWPIRILPQRRSVPIPSPDPLQRAKVQNNESNNGHFDELILSDEIQGRADLQEDPLIINLSLCLDRADLPSASHKV
jgi:hypothetical protein